jgi:hypothetical protein
MGCTSARDKSVNPEKLIEKNERLLGLQYYDASLTTRAFFPLRQEKFITQSQFNKVLASLNPDTCALVAKHTVFDQFLLPDSPTKPPKSPSHPTVVFEEKKYDTLSLITLFILYSESFASEKAQIIFNLNEDTGTGIMSMENVGVLIRKTINCVINASENLAEHYATHFHQYREHIVEKREELVKNILDALFTHRGKTDIQEQDFIERIMSYEYDKHMSLFTPKGIRKAITPFLFNKDGEYESEYPPTELKIVKVETRSA